MRRISLLSRSRGLLDQTWRATVATGQTPEDEWGTPDLTHSSIGHNPHDSGHPNDPFSSAYVPGQLPAGYLPLSPRPDQAPRCAHQPPGGSFVRCQGDTTHMSIRAITV